MRLIKKIFRIVERHCYMCGIDWKDESEYCPECLAHYTERPYNLKKI